MKADQEVIVDCRRQQFEYAVIVHRHVNKQINKQMIKRFINRFSYSPPRSAQWHVRINLKANFGDACAYDIQSSFVRDLLQSTQVHCVNHQQ